MLKALLKKQFSELLYSYLKRGIAKPNEKSGNNKGKLILFGALMLYVVGVFVSLFYKTMQELCPSLCAARLPWLYFSLAGILATALAVIGSIFLVQYQLYEAKDNELLLSMPIPTSYIMFARLLALYVQNFIFEALVFIPAIVVYIQSGQPNAAVVLLCGVLLLLLMPLFSLAITCVLGWLVALLSARLRHRNLAVIVFSLVFIGGYLYVYSRFNTFIQKILANSDVVGEKVRTLFYPFYELGRAGTGNVTSLLLFALITVAVSAVVFFLLKQNFVKLATAKPNEKKAVYKEKPVKVSSVNNALLKREALHLVKSPVYLLNGAFGTFAMLVGAVAIVCKRDLLAFLPTMFGDPSVNPAFVGLGELVVAILLCFICAMNAITAPSVSLEGRSIWIAQSLPVPAERVLFAKLRLHVLVTAPAAFLLTAAFAYALGSSGEMLTPLFLTPLLFTLFSGYVGLVCNLKLPNLKWNNEAYAVKQSFSVLAAILSSLATIGLFIFAVRFLLEQVGAYTLLMSFDGVLIVAIVLLKRWISARGAKIFATLS